MSDGSVIHPDRPEWLAERIQPHIELYAETCGLDLPDDLDCAIADLICDLLLLAHQRGINPQWMITTGVENYETALDEL